MDPFNLARFREAQAGVFEAAQAELRAGRKRTHWMWFMFPQIRGLGFSAMSHAYGLDGRAEAAAYLADPVLGPRLIELFEIALAQKGSAREIFGSPDDLKLRSCATLFAALPGAPPVFSAALDHFFGGMADERTLALAGSSASPHDPAP
jgi:uncharacterized protein (DUF1810 family)